MAGPNSPSARRPDKKSLHNVNAIICMSVVLGNETSSIAGRANAKHKCSMNGQDGSIRIIIAYSTVILILVSCISKLH